MALAIIKFSAQKILFSWAADNFISLATQSLRHKPWFDVAMAGGSTAQGLFQELCSKAMGLDILKQCRFFVSDERMVDLSSEQSNAGNMWRQLLKPLDISADNFFPAYDLSSTLNLSALSYENKLKSLLALDSNHLPVFDLLYLGIGQDGHTASLFPHSLLVNNIKSDVRLVAESEEQAGFKRITFMPRLISAAKNICVMTVGQAKLPIINDIIDGPYEPNNLPAQLVLRSVHEHISLLMSEV